MPGPVGAIQGGLIVWREIIHHGRHAVRQIQAHDRVAIIHRIGVGGAASKRPLPVTVNILPNGLPEGTSAASPAPPIQIPEPLSFGEVDHTPVVARVEALNASSQPCHGPLSPCAAKPTYTMPFSSSSAGRLFSHLGSKHRTPLTLPFPFPATQISPG